MKYAISVCLLVALSGCATQHVSLCIPVYTKVDIEEEIFEDNDGTFRKQSLARITSLHNGAERVTIKKSRGQELSTRRALNIYAGEQLIGGAKSTFNSLNMFDIENKFSLGEQHKGKIIKAELKIEIIESNFPEPGERIILTRTIPSFEIKFE